MDQNLIQNGALWANFLSKLHFGRAFGRTRFPQNEPICAYFRQGMHAGRRRAEVVEYSILTTLQSLNKMIYYNQLQECHSWTRGLCLQ
jgi:hypothetical protein